MRTRSGITLIEILIAVALSGILLTILVKILIPGLQIWRQTEAVSEIEQNAMIAISKIEIALLNTTADSIAVVDRADRQAVSCLDNQGTLTQPGYDGNSADIFWRSTLIFERNPTDNVLRQFQQDLPAPTTTAFAFTESELDAAVTAGSGRLIASKVTDFRLLPPPTDQHIWQLQLTLENNTPRGIHQIEREINFVPRIQNL
jgi:prepilin-type N-terminal cleavage/methylation domain-containing protein